MNDLLLNPNFVAYVINRKFPLDYFFNKMGDRIGFNNVVYCPFHPDDRIGGRPSGKIYHDDNGDTLHCFSEGRQYKAIHFLKLFKKKPDKIFTALWSQMSESDQKEFISSYGNSISFGKIDNSFLVTLKTLRKGEITLQEWKQTVLDGVMDAQRRSQDKLEKDAGWLT